MLQIYTGNGKGKTTAALGLVLRALGAGKRVAWVAFDKGGERHYSERRIIRERFPEIEYHVTGLDRIDAQTGEFRFSVLPEDIVEAKRGLELAKNLLDGKYDLIVLDEVCSCVALGMLEEKEVLSLVPSSGLTGGSAVASADSRFLGNDKKVEIVMTGRNASARLLERADLVTEMKEIKHYFSAGVEAREGYDY